MLKLTEPELKKLLQNGPLLQNMGIEIHQSGPTTLIVRSIPARLPGLDVIRLLSLYSKELGTNGTDSVLQLLRLLAELGSDDVIGRDLNDLAHYLQKLAKLDLPFGNPHYPGLWNTLTRRNLLDLLDGRNTPN
jgi:DNA mismatch repair ATPase MutL